MNISLSKLRITILTVFAVVCLCVGTAWAETELTGPATLGKAGEYYRLSEDITVSGTAFTISGDNITLDLNGHTITYGTSSTGHGVNVSGVRNVTIKNGVIIQGTARSAHSHGIYISSGSGHELHHLVIRVNGDRSFGINSAANNSAIHHVFVNNQGFTTYEYEAPDCIRLEARSIGGVDVYDSILVSGHVGINAQLVGINTENPTQSNLYNNLIQHTRTPTAKSPYGIGLAKCRNVHVYNNQIISDNARGIILDGWGQGAERGTDYCNIYNNRVDVEFSDGGGGISDNMYGIRDRYSSGNNKFENNIVMVTNRVSGRLACATRISSDAYDEKMSDLIVNNNTFIARCEDYGCDSYIHYFAWAYTHEIDITNNKYLTDGVHIQSPENVARLTESNNNVLSSIPTSPVSPTGLTITKFLDSYLLEWDENSEADVYEYYVYRDGAKIPGLSSRGGTFYVDVDIGGTHTYSISGLTLSGNEGPRCPEVSTTSAKIGWWGGSPPSPPSNLRIN